MTGLTELARAHQSVSRSPNSGACLSNLAHQLRLVDRPLEALSWSRWAVRPSAWPEGHVDQRALRVLGAVLIDVGLFAAADEAYRQADPDAALPTVQVSRSRALMGLEAWPQAWALAERRFDLQALPTAALPGPHWRGWPGVEQLNVWDEQGFGDTLQGLRWLPLALKRVERLTLWVRPPLVRLLQQGLAWLGPRLQVRPRPDGADLAWADGCSGSLLSLPLLLGCQQLERGEVLVLPPLSAQPCSAQRRTALRVGLVWESGRYRDDPFLVLEYGRKSLPETIRTQLAAALELRGVEMVSLQLGDAAVPVGADFLEQAEALQCCDLLLVVDTAAAHLAGALGCPTWLLLPWAAASRWQRRRDTTPLYKSLHLIRQPRPGDWQGLLELLLQRLDQALASGDRAFIRR